LPSMIIITIISAFLMQFKENIWVEYAFMGIRVGVAVLILNAAFRIFKKVKKNLMAWILLVFGFVTVYFDFIPIVFVILIGGVVGIIYAVLSKEGEVEKDA